MTDTNSPHHALTWRSTAERNRRLKLWRRAVFAKFGEHARCVRVACALLDLFNVKKGYAFATNRYLAEEANLWENKLRETLLILENGGAIIRANVINPATGQNQRVIYPATAIMPRPTLGQREGAPSRGRGGEPQQPGHQNLRRIPGSKARRSRWPQRRAHGATSASATVTAARPLPQSPRRRRLDLKGAVRAVKRAATASAHSPLSRARGPPRLNVAWVEKWTTAFPNFCAARPTERRHDRDLQHHQHVAPGSGASLARPPTADGHCHQVCVVFKVRAPAPPPASMLSYKTGRPVMSNQVIERKPNGQFAKGVSGNLGGNAQRSRHALNADTIREMHLAFRRGGRKAIDKVMKQQPALFLKLLVLLVPREMEVTHSSAIKSMTDEQIEATIEAIQGMLAAREAGAAAKVIRGWPSRPPCPRPASQGTRPNASPTRREQAQSNSGSREDE